MTNITALRIQGERLGRGEGVHSWHHDTCVRGNLNSSPFLISIPKQKDLLWSLKSHLIRILRGYQPCIIIPPKANNQTDTIIKLTARSIKQFMSLTWICNFINNAISWLPNSDNDFFFNFQNILCIWVSKRILHMSQRFKTMNCLALFTSRWMMVGTLANGMRSSVGTEV